MNDVRELFQHILDEPGPPLAPSAPLLQAARRRRRHRRLAHGLAAAAGVALLAAASAMPLMTWRGGPTNDRSTADGQAAATPTPSTPETHPACQVPEPDMRRQVQRLADAVGASIPRGGRAGTVACEGGQLGVDPKSWYIGASAEVSPDGTSVGTIHAYRFHDAGAGPVDDLCAVAPATRLLPDVRPDALDGTESGCQVLDANGTKVRLARMATSDASVPAVRHAVRYVDGWVILVAELPYTYDPTKAPPSPTAPILSDQQLAELAARAEMLP
jgi:hypothetical protein